MKRIISTILSICIFASVMGSLCFNNNVEVSAKTKLSNKYTLVNASKKTIKKKYISSLNDLVMNVNEIWDSWNCKDNDLEFALEGIEGRSCPTGSYEYFAQNLSRKCKSFNKKDPKKKLSFGNVLNANKVDWLIKNVYNMKPDRTLETERGYYYKNKFYISTELGGGPFMYKLVKIKKIRKARYKIVEKVKWGPDNPWKYRVTLIAELRKSPVIGVYWSYYSYKEKDIK